MNNNNNIENLFRNTLDNYQADVKPELWQAIQSKLPVGNAAGGASVAKGVVAGAKISASSIIIAASVIVIATVSLVLFKSTDKKPVVSSAQVIEQPKLKEDNNADVNENTKISVPTGNSETQIANKQKTEPVKISHSAKPNSGTSNNKTKTNTQLGGSSSNEAENVSSTSNPNTNPVSANNNPDAVSQPNPQSSSENNSKQSETSPDNSNANGAGLEAKQTSSGKALNISDYFGQIPNTFTPNFDGKNDLFMVHPKDIKSFTVTIFDRSGKQIHQWSNPNGFWDGLMNNGQEAPTGSYYYLIVAETIDGQSIKTKLSSLTLFR